jgi:hypothetical protein
VGPAAKWPPPVTSRRRWWLFFFRLRKRKKKAIESISGFVMSRINAPFLFYFFFTGLYNCLLLYTGLELVATTGKPPFFSGGGAYIRGHTTRQTTNEMRMRSSFEFRQGEIDAFFFVFVYSNGNKHRPMYF